jgi:hypothetical protein
MLLVLFGTKSLVESFDNEYKWQGIEKIKNTKDTAHAGCSVGLVSWLTPSKWQFIHFVYVMRLIPTSMLFLLWAVKLISYCDLRAIQLSKSSANTSIQLSKSSANTLIIAAQDHLTYCYWAVRLKIATIDVYDLRLVDVYPRLPSRHIKSYIWTFAFLSTTNSSNTLSEIC